MILITDSATDLPKRYREAWNIPVIPTPVLIGGKDYLDGETINAEEFYRVQTEGKEEIKTYHISPDMFERAFRPYAERGEQVLYLCFSTGIAGTFNAASLALSNLQEEFPGFDLEIFDSRCASAGFGLLVYYIARLFEKGADREVLLEAAAYYRDHIRHIFTVETLEYLIRGGRISRTKGSVAQVLDIKPVLTVNREGALEIYQLVRGRKKSLRALAEFARREAVDLENQTVAVCHGMDMEAAKEVIRQLGSLNQEPLISVVGCAIGAHTGKGMIGVCFLDAEDPYRDWRQEGRA